MSLKLPSWKQGFTLIELLVVIGIIGILAAVVLVAVNPGRQFASARDTQRRSDLYSLTNAVYQYAAENNGSLPSWITTDPQDVRSGTDLETDLTPTYIAALPLDPSSTALDQVYYKMHLDINGRVVATTSSELNPGTVLSVQR